MKHPHNENFDIDKNAFVNYLDNIVPDDNDLYSDPEINELYETLRKPKVIHVINESDKK